MTVPVAHGRWLAEHGPLSIAVGSLAEKLDPLADQVADGATAEQNP